jgi:AcrR family transcriptional regulator
LQSVLRCAYHIGMGVSGVLDREESVPARGARERTRRLMLDTATRMMQEGRTPSVTGVAEMAGVSRATAYRCFPSQTALVGAVVDHGLGTILSWDSDSADAEERVADLLDKSMPRIQEFESTFKAALKLSLEQQAEQQAGEAGDGPPFKRGHRVDLLQHAISPLRSKLSKAQFVRLARALSLVYGVEVLIVLQDIWGLSASETKAVAVWAGRALVKTALSETKDREQTFATKRKGR